MHIFGSSRRPFLSAVAFTALASSFLSAAYATTVGVESIIYTFPAGEAPSPLIQASDGNFYGTVSNDGANGNGYVFQLMPGGGHSIIYSFTGAADGGTPMSSLIEGNDGNLYGTNTTGGSGNGVMFSVTLAGSISVLHTFATGKGSAPGSLIQNNAGDFFGIEAGGASSGTVFEYSHEGVFSSYTPTTGFTPNAPLLQASDGLVYGVTAGAGSIFRFDPADLSSLANVANFPLGVPNPNHPPYADPQFGLTEGSDSALYGLTLAGGPAYAGSLYRVVLGSVPSVDFDLYDFASQDSEFPQSGLTLGGDGNLYGSATTIFQFLPEFGDTLNPLNQASTDIPYGAPIEGMDGSLYGVNALSPASRVYKLALTPVIPPPIVIAVSPASISLGQDFRLAWQVNNAASNTMQNCWAHGAWSGSRALSGSDDITPTVSGTLTFALTCGGVESGLTTVVVTPGAPAVTLAPTGLTFTARPLGTISAYQQVTVSNTGNATLNISSISAAGTEGTEFFLPSNRMLCGSTLAAGASCTFDVAFEPTIAGPVTVAIAIFDNAPGTVQLVDASGTGIAAPVVSLSPASSAFADTNVGSVASYHRITVSNTGDLTLNINSIAVTGTNASSFFLPGNHMLCGSALAAGASCTFDVAFGPTTSGPLSAAVLLTDNVAGAPQSIAVRGTGVAAPVLSLSPTSLGFASTNVGSVASYHQITVTNTGDAALDITSIAVTGTNASSFFLPGNHMLCGSALAAGASCTFDVAFGPKSTGALSAVVQLTDNAAESPQFITVYGAGQ